MTLIHKNKLKEWLKRYLPAEVFAVTGALAGGLLVSHFFHNPLKTALGATWGETFGYYARLFYGDLKKRKYADNAVTLKGILKVIRDLLVEFGVAEYLDALLVRPSMMYIFPLLVRNIVIGLILGKFAADIIFYIPTISFYELRKNWLKD